MFEINTMRYRYLWNEAENRQLFFKQASFFEVAGVVQKLAKA